MFKLLNEKVLKIKSKLYSLQNFPTKDCELAKSQDETRSYVNSYASHPITCPSRLLRTTKKCQ